MKKLSIFVAALLMGGAAFFAWVGIAECAKLSIPARVSISRKLHRSINKTIYTAGQTVDIAADVNGDIFCMGKRSPFQVTCKVM